MNGFEKVCLIFVITRFESCVILNGSKTATWQAREWPVFESCVILNGSKTREQCEHTHAPFESCVILNGSKTRVRS